MFVAEEIVKRRSRPRLGVLLSAIDKRGIRVATGGKSLRQVCREPGYAESEG